MTLLRGLHTCCGVGPGATSRVAVVVDDRSLSSAALLDPLKATVGKSSIVSS